MQFLFSSRSRNLIIFFFFCACYKQGLLTLILNEIVLNKSPRNGIYYAKIDESNMFEIAQPRLTLGIGVDAIPASIRNSKVLTGNNLGMLALVEHLPAEEEVAAFKKLEAYQYLNKFEGDEKTFQIHRFAQELLNGHQIKEAWIALLAF